MDFLNLVGLMAEVKVLMTMIVCQTNLYAMPLVGAR